MVDTSRYGFSTSDGTDGTSNIWERYASYGEFLSSGHFHPVEEKKPKKNWRKLIEEGVDVHD